MIASDLGISQSGLLDMPRLSRSTAEGRFGSKGTPIIH